MDPTKNELDTIKQLLIQIIKGKTAGIDRDIDTLHTSMPDSLEGLSSIEILLITVPFIVSYTKEDIKGLEEFIMDVIQLQPENTENTHVDNVDIHVETMRNQLNSCSQAYTFNPLKTLKDIKAGSIDRMDKIHLNNTIKRFNLEFVDWEDKEFLSELLEVCLFKALLHLRSLLAIQAVKTEDKTASETPKMQVFRLLKCGHLNPVIPDRKALLKRHNEPTMTMDEYVSRVLADLERRESSQNVEKLEPQKKDTASQRKKDDFDEFCQNFKGNTKNMG